MVADPRLLIGASPSAWVTDLVNWVAEQGGAQIVGHAMHERDMLDSDFDVLVVDVMSTLLSRRLVDEVHGAGRAVLALTSPSKAGDSEVLLDSLGVRLAMPVTAPPQELVRRAAEFAAQRRKAGPPTGANHTTPKGEPDRPQGSVTVVVGLDGTLEVATHLAATLAAAGASPVLCDLDTVWPAVAQRLGVPLAPNVLSALEDSRQAAFGKRSYTAHPAGMGVLAGLANPREWAELSALDAEHLLATLRARFREVVVVTAPLLEPLAPMSGLEGRYDVHRSVVEAADRVVVVVPASPVGVARGLTLVADVRGLSQAPVHVVVNRTPRQGFKQAEWRDEFSRTFAPTSLTFLPDDRRVREGSWEGTLTASNSYRRMMASLASAVRAVPA